MVTLAPRLVKGSGETGLRGGADCGCGGRLAVHRSIRALLPGLPEAQRTTAALILDGPAAAARMTITELADACHVSTGSVTRFCRALGLPGYAALRIALASDIGCSERETWQANMERQISENDELSRVAEAISAAVRHSVGETLARHGHRGHQ